VSRDSLYRVEDANLITVQLGTTVATKWYLGITDVLLSSYDVFVYSDCMATLRCELPYARSTYDKHLKRSEKLDDYRYIIFWNYARTVRVTTFTILQKRMYTVLF
jgi:hypothetical protein